MLTKEMEYHPVYSLKETPGYFMSRAKALLILLAFVSLVIVLIVLAVMLAQQKGTQGKVCEGKDDPIGKWKQVFIRGQSTFHLDMISYLLQPQ